MFSAISGYVVMLLAWRVLGSEDYSQFAAYWGAFFALGGVANGLMQEITRSVRVTGAGTVLAPSGTRVRLLPAGLLLGIVFAVAVFVSGPAWSSLGLPTHSGVGVMLMAVGILGFTLQAATAGALSGTERWKSYAVLLTVDAALRLIVAGAAGLLGGPGFGFAVATVAGTVAWALLATLSPSTRAALRSALDVGPGVFWRNTASAMLASSGTSALVVGFPVLITATARDSDPAPLVGAVILAITLTRAPLLVPLTSFQSAMIVYFVGHRRDGVRSLVAPLGAVAAAGLAGASAAWLIGPWLLGSLFGDASELPGAVLAALTASSVGTAALMVTSNAALAFNKHVLYSAGWWTAVTVSGLLLVFVPSSLEIRAAVALLVGSGIGVLVQLIGLSCVRKVDLGSALPS